MPGTSSGCPGGLSGGCRGRWVANREQTGKPPKGGRQVPLLPRLGLSPPLLSTSHCRAGGEQKPVPLPRSLAGSRLVSAEQEDVGLRGAQCRVNPWGVGLGWAW